MDALSWSHSRLRWHVRLRRTLFFGLTLLTAGCASALLLDVLQANSLSGIELVGLLLFFALFAWIASAFWSAIARSPVPHAASSTRSPGRTAARAASRRQRMSSPAVMTRFITS